MGSTMEMVSDQAVTPAVREEGSERKKKSQFEWKTQWKHL